MKNKEEIEKDNGYYCGICENYGDKEMCPYIDKANRYDKPSDFKCHLFW